MMTKEEFTKIINFMEFNSISFFILSKIRSLVHEVQNYTYIYREREHKRVRKKYTSIVIIINL